MMPLELKCVKCTKVDRSTRNVVYVLVATFAVDNKEIENCYVGKTLSDLIDFRKSVIQLSAGQDNNSKSSSHLLPDYRRPLFPGRRDEKNKSSVDDFCQHFTKLLPVNLLSDDLVVDFFHDSSAPSEDGAIELYKAKESSAAAKKTTKVGGNDVIQRLRETFNNNGRESGKADLAASASSPTSSSPTSASHPSAAAAAATASKPFPPFTIVDATYAEIKFPDGDDVIGRPTLVSEYAEVTSSEETPNNPSSRAIFTDDAEGYAECREPGANSLHIQSSSSAVETVKLREKPGRPVDEEALYASVFRGAKGATHDDPQPTPTYEDTTNMVFPPPKRDVKMDDEPVLYADASCTVASSHHHLQQQQQPKPPAPPRPRGPSNSSNVDANSSASPTKPLPSPSSSPVPSSSAFTPLTPIPPMPQFPSPALLLNPDTLLNGSAADGQRSELGGVGGGGEIQVVAIGDYDSTSDSVLSFRRGTLATLLLQSDSNWWCIRISPTTHGWVPADYWRMLNTGDCASLITRGNSPWFVGKLSRSECETLLMEHGKQQHFVVRESDSGRYALSIKYNDRIHHFPIEVTPDKKYNIGKHDFKTVNNVILYYQKNALFHDEHGKEVTLGSPLVIIKH